MDKVFNDLLTAAVLQKFRPLGLYTHALLVVVGQRVHVEVVVGPHVNVEASSREEDSEDDHSVDSISDYGAFTEAEVPDLTYTVHKCRKGELCDRVVWHLINLPSL